MPRPEGLHSRRESAMAVPQIVRERDESRAVSGSSKGKEEKLKREMDKAEVRVE